MSAWFTMTVVLDPGQDASVARDILEAARTRLFDVHRKCVEVAITEGQRDALTT